jgi:hypothetical protein
LRFAFVEQELYFLRDMFSTGRIMIKSIIPSTRNSSVGGLIVESGHRADLRIILEGILQLDTYTSPTSSNVSVPSYIGPRINGAIIHVCVGDQGVIPRKCFHFPTLF